MPVANELEPSALIRTYDPAEVPFDTTDDIDEQHEIVGQGRAVSAIQLGVAIGGNRHNIFAMGPAGTGKHSIVRRFLEERAATRPAPDDLCYVHNFDRRHEPRLLYLPAGRGAELRNDMEELVEEVRTALAAAFEGEEYQARRQAIEEEFSRLPEKHLAEVERRAKAEGLVLLRAPMGLAFAPTKGDEVLSADDFEKLPRKEQAEIKARVERYQAEAQETFQKVPKWDRERRGKIQALHGDITDLAVGDLIKELRAKYETLPRVLEYLDAVAEDIRSHTDDFVRPEPKGPTFLKGMESGLSPLRRYRVNLLVQRTEIGGAPVEYEDHPSYDNLIGRIDHIPQFGGLVTDHDLIKPGALHRAHGGYLILEAHKLLRAPYAYDALKRALQSSRLRIESLGQALSLVGTVSMQPEPLDLDVQVVLLGEPLLYYLLGHYDPDFDKLFKVVADFDHHLHATEQNRQAYAKLIAHLVRKEEVRPFDRTAVARIMQHSARMSEDQEKMSARIELVSDLIRESNYWAEEASDEVVTATHVQQCIDAQIHRQDRIRERYQEEILNGTIQIDSDGSRLGQINGLAVVQLGGFAFGHPSRITARVRVGEGEVVDIEREVELGGPIHSKGVLILEAFLGARYARDKPLSLAGSLVFEQTYTGIEGDSASAAELFVLLSAITDKPIRQSLAVTGSVNQHGEIQAIGGVNEKIEGFFDVCNERGLTGEQGVLIPASNQRHLMLERRVVDAVEAGKFHVFPIATVDEGLELLFGMPAGVVQSDGTFPENTFNRLVEDRLAEFAEERRVFKSGSDDAEEGD